MESHKTRRDMVAVAVAVALALPLAACSSGGSSGSSGSSAVVTTLNVLDYYNNEPDNGFYQKALDACGQANGVTIQRQTLSLIHISEPTRLGMISYAVFCLKK